MFKEILSILRRDDLLKQAMEEAGVMFSKAELMFRNAIKLVMECQKPDVDMYETDREINRMEWAIRQKVLEHLVLTDKKDDASAVLILTSAVVDIERIGDYSKNMMELADICEKAPLIEERHGAFFKETEEQILEIFELTRDAYRNGDKEKAQRAMDIHWQISANCDRMFEELASERELDTEYAVIYTLLARYLKRVSSHLKNIASSAVNPFPKMGFRYSEEGEDLDIG